METAKELFQWKEKCKQLNLYLKAAISDNKVISEERNKMLLEKRKIQENLDVKIAQIKRLEEEKEKINEENAALRKANEELDTLNEAVEKVAENFCEENLKVNEEKLKVVKENRNLKRQSTMLAQQLNIPIDINFDDDLNSPPTPINRSSSTLQDLREIYEQKHQEAIEEERKKSVVHQKKCEELQIELDVLNKEISEIKQNIEHEKSHKGVAEEARDVSLNAYNELKEEYDKMLECFLPFIKMKQEYEALKRTSTTLLSDAAEDTKYKMVFQISEELKKEVSEKSVKIFKLESQLTETEDSMRQNELKMLELEKKIESLNHENRILTEQKQGFGVPAPPPPPVNLPPPPPPISSLFKRIIKTKHNNKNPAEPKSDKDQKVADLMNELQRRLQSRIKDKNKIETIPKDTSTNESDSSTSFKVPVKLRSFSVDSTPLKSKQKETNEFQKIFQKFKCREAINEKRSNQNSINSQSSNQNSQCLIDGLDTKIKEDDSVFNDTHE